MAAPEFLGEPFLLAVRLTVGAPSAKLVWPSYGKLFITSLACYNFEGVARDVNLHCLEREDGAAVGTLETVGSKSVAFGPTATTPQEFVGSLLPSRPDPTGKFLGTHWDAAVELHVSCTTLAASGIHVVFAGFFI